VNVAPRSEEAIVPLAFAPAAVPPITHVRSTMIVNSLRQLGELGLEAPYWQHLASAHRAEIREMVPQSWLPMTTVVAHYEAVDELGIADDVARRNGGKSMENLQGSYVGTLLRGLGGAGVVSPPMLLARASSMWDRMARGGAIAVFRVGPKEVRIENHGTPLGRFRYNNAAYEGYVQAGLSLVASRVAVRYLADRSGPMTSMFRVTWI